MRLEAKTKEIPDNMIEDEILDAVMDKMKELNKLIQTWNTKKRDTLPQIVQFYDDFVDPYMMTKTPALQVFLDTGEDEEKNRGAINNVSTVRVMTVLKGPQQPRASMRIHGLIRFLLDQDWTLGCKVGQTRIIGRTFYDPFSQGNFEFRVGETYIEVTKEVRR